ncbi:hypothetical protein ABTX71_32800 [Streptomyces parvulus]
MGFASKELKADLGFCGAELLHPSFTREQKRKGKSTPEGGTELIESVNDNPKGPGSTWNNTVAGASG